jgi:hypothetical protein
VEPARTRVAAAVAVLFVGVAVGGCTKAGGRATGTPNSATTSPSAVTGSTPSGEESAGIASGAPVLADGRHPVYLTGLDLKGRTVTFDLIEFLTGAEAKKAWLKAHPDEPDGPPNDYFIVNDNPKLRTLPMATNVQVVVVDMSGAGGVTGTPIALTALPAHLAEQKPTGNDKRLSYAPYWLTVASGQLTRIEEQFVP